MADELISADALLLRVEEGLAQGLNRLALGVYKRSQVEVPKDVGPGAERDVERHGVQLVDAGLYPLNEPAYAATPGKLTAIVAYEHAAAVSQHEGAMSYERGGKEVEWKVEHYTTPGTKRKYLEDPFKAALPEAEGVCAAYVEAALEELHAPNVSLRVESGTHSSAAHPSASSLHNSPEVRLVATAAETESHSIPGGGVV